MPMPPAAPDGPLPHIRPPQEAAQIFERYLLSLPAITRLESLTAAQALAFRTIAGALANAAADSESTKTNFLGVLGYLTAATHAASIATLHEDGRFCRVCCATNFQIHINNTAGLAYAVDGPSEPHHG